MSKEFETDQNIRYENKLKYDYVGSNINKYEMNVPIDKTKPLDMTFFNGTTEPNIVYYTRWIQFGMFPQEDLCIQVIT